MNRLKAAWLTAGLVAALSACGAPSSGDRVLVTSGFTDQVFVLDAETGAVIDSIAVDPRPAERDEPHGVAVAPDGRHWYATASHGEASLWKFETEGNRLVGRLKLPTRGASRVRISPDGTLAAVPDYWLAGGGEDSDVTVVRTHDLSVVAQATVCPAPHDAVFDPTGAWLAVTCAAGNEVVVVDAKTLAVRARHAVGDGVGIKPLNVAWSASGDRVYATLMGRADVVELSPGDTSGAALMGHHEVGQRPAQIEFALDGRALVVADRGEAAVSILDLEAGTRRSVSMPGAHPHGVAVDPTGRIAFITYEGDTESGGGVVALDVAEGRIVWSTEVGVFTLGVAYLPG